MKRAGKTLPILLILIALAASLTFALAERFLVRQRFTRHLEFHSQAENLAQSGISEAIARVRQDANWGTTAQTYALERTMPHTHDPQAGFSLTFDPSRPNASVNNVRGDFIVKNCPPGALLLTSTGHCNGYTSTCQALIAAPPFPYAIASSGPIRSQNGLVLGSVPAGFDPTAGLDLDRLGPAEMMTQGLDDAGGAALVLKGQSTIVGTGHSAGSVDIDEDTVKVDGELLPNARTEDVPLISLSELDFTSDPNTQTLPRSDFQDSEKLSGLLQWSPTSGESLTFKKGLALNGATLRVRGNLVIEGPITGAGALLVDGNVTIQGGAQLSADNQVAILSQGSVSVTGQGAGSSYLQGLIYAAGEDGIKLQDCTVVGTVLNAGKTSSGAGAPMQVERATVAFDSKAVSMSVDLSASGVDDGTRFSRARLKNPLPLSTFYRDGAWDIPSNVRPPYSASNPFGFSPLELVLLPHLELQIDGKWYASADEAVAAGVSQTAVRNAVIKAGNVYAGQLAQASSQPPVENSSLTFQLDLNRYLKHSERLRVVRLESL